VHTTGDRAVAGSSALPKGTWTHIASTWEGGLLRLYVNGAEVAKASLRQDAVRSGRALRFGGYTVWREWFKGAIDEIRIYDRAPTPVDIEADRSTSIGVIRDVTTKVRRRAAGKNKEAGKRRGSKRQQRGHRTRWLR
jgi:Concanavalin A-like lectin/glucanases superfamily